MSADGRMLHVRRNVNRTVLQERMKKKASHYIKMLNICEHLMEEWKDCKPDEKFWRDHQLQSFLEDIDARIEK